MEHYKINSPHVWLRKPWTTLLKAVKLYACIHIHLPVSVLIYMEQLPCSRGFSLAPASVPSQAGRWAAFSLISEVRSCPSGMCM